jgi:lysyl-tRNA synthetase class 1
VSRSARAISPRNQNESMTEFPAEWLEAARVSKAWPFEEARKLLARAERKGSVLFETGYGPSGLPHIGTFGEVARTSMVRHAFRLLAGDAAPTRLVCFSDDMDGLRKVPDNVPTGTACSPTSASR